MMNWHIGYIMKKDAQRVMSIIESNFHEYGIRYHYPSFKKEVIKKNQIIVENEILYPNYIFIGVPEDIPSKIYTKFFMGIGINFLKDGKRNHILSKKDLDYIKKCTLTYSKLNFAPLIGLKLYLEKSAYRGFMATIKSFDIDNMKVEVGIELYDNIKTVHINIQDIREHIGHKIIKYKERR